MAVRLLTLEYFRWLLSHPTSGIDYAFRYYRISKLTGVSPRSLRFFFAEAEEIYKILEEVTNPFEEMPLGCMLSPLRGPVLYVICRALRPTLAVETGTASGVSTRFILAGMERNLVGKLCSIDFPVDPHGVRLPPGKETGWLVPKELRHRWELIVGKTKEMLEPVLSRLGKIDFFLHDSEHTYENMTFELDTAWRFLRPGGLILCDDIDRNSAFTDFAKRTNSQYSATLGALGVIRKRSECSSAQ
jgi:predicted O-methyltransferase YrrM